MISWSRTFALPAGVSLELDGAVEGPSARGAYALRFVAEYPDAVVLVRVRVGPHLVCPRLPLALLPRDHLPVGGDEPAGARCFTYDLPPWEGVQTMSVTLTNRSELRASAGTLALQYVPAPSVQVSQALLTFLQRNSAPGTTVEDMVAALNGLTAEEFALVDPRNTSGFRLLAALPLSKWNA